jgi:hypothetical protein
MLIGKNLQQKEMLVGKIFLFIGFAIHQPLKSW